LAEEEEKQRVKGGNKNKTPIRKLTRLKTNTVPSVNFTYLPHSLSTIRETEIKLKNE